MSGVMQGWSGFYFFKILMDYSSRSNNVHVVWVLLFVLMKSLVIWCKFSDKLVCFSGFDFCFKAIPAALGVSSTKQYHVNSLAVRRKAKEAIGGISKLTHTDGNWFVYVCSLLVFFKHHVSVNWIVFGLFFWYDKFFFFYSILILISTIAHLIWTILVQLDRFVGIESVKSIPCYHSGKKRKKNKCSICGSIFFYNDY